MDNHNSDKNKKNIRQENEELRKLIQEEFGGKSWVNPDSDLPPELENEFLNHIMAFEEAFENNVQITVFEFIGKPKFKFLGELKEDEISNELNRILTILEDNQIHLNTLCEVSDKELYRFITEEFFYKEKDDMRIPGMTTHFTYEDYYPNQDYNIRLCIDNFISFFLDKESNPDFYLIDLSQKAKNESWHSNLRDTFSSFENKMFEIFDVEFSLDTGIGKVLFDCEIKATVDSSDDVFLFKGEGNADIIYKDEYWYIDKFELPNPTI